MSAERLEAKLAGLEGSCAIAPYVTAGDGGLERTLLVLEALERAGAACCELGVPFSDPIADGPLLQAAAQRALDAGTNLGGVLEVVRRFRAGGGEMPICLFSYANPILRRGWDGAARALAEAGVDGILIPDLPVEEGAPLCSAAEAAGIATIFFVTPTTSDARVVRAAEASRGFLYVIGRTGITGASTDLSGAAVEYLARVKGLSRVPLGVGFGIASADQVAAVAPHARLAIVGTALVQRVHEGARDARDPDAEAAAVAFEFVRGLADGVGRGGDRAAD